MDDRMAFRVVISDTGVRCERFARFAGLWVIFEIVTVALISSSTNPKTLFLR